MKLTDTQLQKTISLAREYGATHLILFGSSVEKPDYARDLDLACDGVPGWKLYELGARLEDELRVSVDLIPLSPPNRFTEMVMRHGKNLL